MRANGGGSLGGGGSGGGVGGGGAAAEARGMDCHRCQAVDRLCSPSIHFQSAGPSGCSSHSSCTPVTPPTTIVSTLAAATGTGAKFSRFWMSYSRVRRIEGGRGGRERGREVSRQSEGGPGAGREQWRKHIPEWSKLVHDGHRVMSTESQANPPDPYEALKRGELLAISAAQALAPK